METKTFCPLGSKCEEARDGAVHRCKWYMHIKGQDPQTGEDIDTWNCVLAWTPILLIENSRQSLATGSAIESFRNEVVKGNSDFISFMQSVSAKKITS